MRNAFAEAKQRYGAPRLAEELPEYNIKTIAASLHRQELRAKASRKFSPVNYREHEQPVSENVLKQQREITNIFVFYPLAPRLSIRIKY